MFPRLRTWCSLHIAQILGLVLLLVAAHWSPAFSAALTGGALLVGSVNVTDDMVKYLIKQGVLDAAGGVRLNFSAKTGDYTILSASDPSGTVFTNRGAGGAVVFTLPAPSPAIAGVFYDFLGIADQAFSVKTATADTLIVVNDVAADSLAVSTASHKIGACMRAMCDGTSWIAFGLSVGDTFTVAT